MVSGNESAFVRRLHHKNAENGGDSLGQFHVQFQTWNPQGHPACPQKLEVLRPPAVCGAWVEIGLGRSTACICIARATRSKAKGSSMSC